MTLTERLREKLAFNEASFTGETQEFWREATQTERDRIKPIYLALIGCVAALERTLEFNGRADRNKITREALSSLEEALGE